MVDTNHIPPYDEACNKLGHSNSCLSGASFPFATSHSQPRSRGLRLKQREALLPRGAKTFFFLSSWSCVCPVAAKLRASRCGRSESAARGGAPHPYLSHYTQQTQRPLEERKKLCLYITPVCHCFIRRTVELSYIRLAFICALCCV